MNRFFMSTPINPRHCGPDSLRPISSSLTLRLAAGLLMALALGGCDLAAETGADSVNQSEQQGTGASADSSASDSLWRYQNTRLGDPKGDEEIYPEASGSSDPLITPIHRRSAHSIATLEAKQINQDQASRSVTLSIKTDPTHGRYLTLSDPELDFDCQPSCELRARFDSGESQKFEFQASDAHLLYLLKDTQANRLVDQIKTAQTLQLSAPNKSSVRYTFDVRGLDLSQIAL